MDRDVVTPPGSNEPHFLTSAPGVNKAGGGEHGPQNPSNWTLPVGGDHAPAGEPASGGEHGPETPVEAWTSPSPGYNPGSGGTHGPNAPFKNPGHGQ